jgi:hypothetical protein
VATDDQVWIPLSDPTAGSRPLKSAPAASKTGSLELCPRSHVLEAMVAVPDAVTDRIADQRELGDAVMVDLGEALSSEADKTFLNNLADDVSKDKDRVAVTKGDLLERLVAVIDTLRAKGLPFRTPGWILNPETLDRVARIRTTEGTKDDRGPAARSLTELGLVRLVSAGEGMLLGFPYVTSAVATNGAGKARIYFGSDWPEAYVGVDPCFVMVDVPGAPGVPDHTVIRASMPVDFALRRPKAFAVVDPP